MAGTEKLLPQNLEAELAALGCLRIDPDAIRDVRGWLAPGDFYRGAHRIVCEAIYHLHDRGEPADSITLGDYLERIGKLEEVGGYAFVARLGNNVPHSGNLIYYARIIERTAVLRRLIHAAGQIAAIAYNEPDASVALAESHKLIRAAGDRKSEHDSIPLDQAIRDWLSGVYAMMDTGPRGLLSGFVELDAHTMGFLPTESWIVTAVTSGGKSAWALSVATTMAMRQAALADMGKRAGAVEYITLEMSTTQQVQRMLAAWTNTNGRALRADFWDGAHFDADLFHALEPEALRLAEVIKGYLRFSDMPMRLSQLEAHLERAVEERNCPIAFVDYITLLDAENSRADDRQKVNELTWRIKQIAQRLKIPIVSLMQMSRKYDARENKRPQLTDLKNSSDAEQNADGVIGIHLPELYDPDNPAFKGFGELWVLKARGSRRDVWVPFRYEGEYTRCSNWDRREHGIPLDPTRPGGKAA